MSDTTLQSTTTDVVDAHLAAYGEPDGDRRRALVERAWAPDGTLTDPPFEPTTGHDAIDRLYGEVQGQYPGHTFRRSSAVDGHHGFARYGWEMLDAAGGLVLAGTDVVETALDGRLAGVVGFFGDLG